VSSFVEKSFLKLNIQKCEVMVLQWAELGVSVVRKFAERNQSAWKLFEWTPKQV